MVQIAESATNSLTPERGVSGSSMQRATLPSTYGSAALALPREQNDAKIQTAPVAATNLQEARAAAIHKMSEIRKKEGWLSNFVNKAWEFFGSSSSRSKVEAALANFENYDPAAVDKMIDSYSWRQTVGVLAVDLLTIIPTSFLFPMGGMFLFGGRLALLASRVGKASRLYRFASRGIMAGFSAIGSGTATAGMQLVETGTDSDGLTKADKWSAFIIGIKSALATGIGVGIIGAWGDKIRNATYLARLKSSGDKVAMRYAIGKGIACEAPLDGLASYAVEGAFNGGKFKPSDFSRDAAISFGINFLTMPFARAGVRHHYKELYPSHLPSAPLSSQITLTGGTWAPNTQLSPQLDRAVLLLPPVEKNASGVRLPWAYTQSSEFPGRQQHFTGSMAKESRILSSDKTFAHSKTPDDLPILPHPKSKAEEANVSRPANRKALSDPMRDINKRYDLKVEPLKDDSHSYLFTIGIKEANEANEHVAYVNYGRDCDNMREQYEEFFRVGNEIQIKLPVINYKTNAIAKEIKVFEISIFDNTGKVVFEVDKDHMPRMLKKLNIEKDFELQRKRHITIGGTKEQGDCLTIATGVAEGEVIVVNNPHEYVEKVEKYRGQTPKIVLMNDSNTFLNDILVNAETFRLPKNIKGVVAHADFSSPMLTDVLGHVASRLRHRQTVTVFPSNSDGYKKVAQFLESKVTVSPAARKFVQIDANELEFRIKGIDKRTRTAVRQFNNAELDRVSVCEPVRPGKGLEFSERSVGLKAANLWKLMQLSNSPEAQFTVPRFFAIPSGLIEEIKKANRNTVYGRMKTYKPGNGNNYQTLVREIDYKYDAKRDREVTKILEEIQDLIEKRIVIPEKIENQIFKTFNSVFGDYRLMDADTVNGVSKIFPGVNTGNYSFNKLPVSAQANAEFKPFCARSSFIGEDYADIPTAGLFDSVVGLYTKEDIMRGIRRVWASKWSDLAFHMRRDYGIAHNTMHPNIVIQEMANVDYTFTIYTSGLDKGNKKKVIIQLSQGIDSGQTGNPYIFTYKRPNGSGEESGGIRSARVMLANKRRMKTIRQMAWFDQNRAIRTDCDYNRLINGMEYEVFNRGKDAYDPVIEKAARQALLIEEKVGMGKPQDIEGGIKFEFNERTGKVEPNIYIWQTRDIYYPPSSRPQT